MVCEHLPIFSSPDSVLHQHDCCKQNIILHWNLQIFCGPHLPLGVDISLQKYWNIWYETIQFIYRPPKCTSGEYQSQIINKRDFQQHAPWRSKYCYQYYQCYQPFEDVRQCICSPMTHASSFIAVIDPEIHDLATWSTSWKFPFWTAT
jgi:hypothetical protein